MSLFDEIGGRDTLMRISKKFYDKIYKHPWMSLYFKNTKQSVIESQQVDFMTGALGGPKIYAGRMPLDAHTHLFITEELFDLRQQLLKETFVEENAPQELVDRWLKIDEAFRSQIIKKSPDDCFGRWKTEEILNFPNPEDKNQRKVS